jgi:site-specific DNA recombinase
MNAAIYARKSTEQTGVADDQKSIARQVEHARAYAAAKGWSVNDDGVFVDDGISGAEFANRPGFLRLMNALKPRPAFQILVMSEESRLGREMTQTMGALGEIVRAGVRVFYYMDDKEATLNSPIEKAMMMMGSFSAELEREKARQRTYDAMIRKARAGHVTGGRVFGYDNVRGDSHVERRLNEREAAIVRRIFEMCAGGKGLKTIAITLNDEGAVSPRAQQGRPQGWAPSSVRELLYRPLYRGEIVWNRTKKRNTWGVTHAQDRAESDWIRVDAPHLRIVTDAEWTAAHARLQASQRTYLRGTDGRLWGRPMSGIDSKHLLTGLARCSCCGGGVLVKSRAHGRKRAVRYGRSSYHLRGRSICENGREMSMADADAAMLDAIREDVLDPEVIDLAVAEAVQTLSAAASGDSLEAVKADLQGVTGELQRLTSAIAAGGDVPTLVGAIRERETRRTRLQTQLAAMTEALAQAAKAPADIESQLRKRLSEWRQLLGQEISWTRQIIQKLLVEKIICRPVIHNGEDCYELTARFHLGRFFEGIICPRGLASPTGFEPVF